MDGRVLAELFDEVTRESRSADPLGSSAKDASSLDEGLSEDEEALVEERLRGLGYIE